MSVKHFVDSRGKSRYLAGKHTGNIDDPFVPIVAAENSSLEIALGNSKEYVGINKFGRRIDVDLADLPAAIWDAPSNVFQMPTEARIHSIVSTSIEDTGAIISSGAITSPGVVNPLTSNITMFDADATFITDGVSIGSTIINTITNDHSVIAEVLSETSIVMLPPHHGSKASVGQQYMIVAATGTGCGLVHITIGLDENMNPVKEFIIMNGTTPVNTVNKYTRIDRIHSDHNGSNRANVGDISMTAAVDNTITAFIKAGMNQTYTAHYTVPHGYDAVITEMHISLNRNRSTSGAMASFSLMTDKFAPFNPTGSVPIFSVSAAVDGSSFIDKEFRPAIFVEERTDIYILCTDASDSNLEIDAGFSVILYKKS